MYFSVLKQWLQTIKSNFAINLTFLVKKKDQYDKKYHNNNNYAIIIMDNYKVQLRTGLFVTGKGV